MALGIDLWFWKKLFIFWIFHNIYHYCTINAALEAHIGRVHQRFKTHCLHGNLASAHLKVLLLQKLYSLFFSPTHHNLARSRYWTPVSTHARDAQYRLFKNRKEHQYVAYIVLFTDLRFSFSIPFLSSPSSLRPSTALQLCFVKERANLLQAPYIWN